MSAGFGAAAGAELSAGAGVAAGAGAGAGDAPCGDTGIGMSLGAVLAGAGIVPMTPPSSAGRLTAVPT